MLMTIYFSHKKTPNGGVGVQSVTTDLHMTRLKLKRLSKRVFGKTLKMYLGSASTLFFQVLFMAAPHWLCHSRDVKKPLPRNTPDCATDGRCTFGIPECVQCRRHERPARLARNAARSILAAVGAPLWRQAAVASSRMPESVQRPGAAPLLNTRPHPLMLVLQMLPTV